MFDIKLTLTETIKTKIYCLSAQESPQGFHCHINIENNASFLMGISSSLPISFPQLDSTGSRRIVCSYHRAFFFFYKLGLSNQHLKELKRCKDFPQRLKGLEEWDLFLKNASVIIIIIQKVANFSCILGKENL